MPARKKMGVGIFIEAGHGMNFRAAKQEDLGLLGEKDITEAGIVQEYASRLNGEVMRQKHYGTKIIRGSVAARITFAKRRKADILISLHMCGDPSGLSRGDVLYSTDSSQDIALAVGAALSKNVRRVEPTGEHAMLQWSPAIEIELGNIACQQDLKNLAYSQYCNEMNTKLLGAIEKWFYEKVGYVPS